MRILFAGTPAIAVPSLERLVRDFEVCGVITNPDKRTGRGRNVVPPVVKVTAQKFGIPVLQFASLKKDAREAVRVLHPHILIVFAYGRIFGPQFLSLFPMGGFNIHPSLLPRYRGSSPLVSAILAGDTETGITVQTIAPVMDTGDIVKQIVHPLSGRETTASLSIWAASESASLISEVLEDMTNGALSPYPQNNAEATYCKKITKEDGLIHWSEYAECIERKIRAFTPWP